MNNNKVYAATEQGVSNRSGEHTSRKSLLSNAPELLHLTSSPSVLGETKILLLFRFTVRKIISYEGDH